MLELPANQGPASTGEARKVRPELNDFPAQAEFDKKGNAIPPGKEPYSRTERIASGDGERITPFSVMIALINPAGVTSKA